MSGKNTELPEWHLEKRLIKDLKPHPKNPRMLSKHDAAHLQKSLEKFGIIDKPIITGSGLIIGGHQRISILKKMGAKEVLCYVPDKDLTDEDIDELNIRLNRNCGEWDYDILANEWKEDVLFESGFTKEELSLGDVEDVETKPQADSVKKKKMCPACGHEF
jgi:ParB-like chromosome segregation protein Spo0J